MLYGYGWGAGLLRIIIHGPALQVVERLRPRGYWGFAPGCMSRGGTGGPGELLQFPHVLPLFLGGHLLFVWRRSVELLFCFLLGDFTFMLQAGFFGGDKRPDGQDNEDDVGRAISD